MNKACIQNQVFSKRRKEYLRKMKRKDKALVECNNKRKELTIIKEVEKEGKTLQLLQ